MPNLLHRFPVLTTCGHARIDFRDKIFSSRLALIEKISEVASHIDIKPYNKNNFEFAKENYLLLEQVAKKNVRIIESTQKGPDQHLLRLLNRHHHHLLILQSHKLKVYPILPRYLANFAPYHPSNRRKKRKQR